MDIIDGVPSNGTINDETDAALTTSGTLSISDVDSAATFIAQTDTAGTYGTFSIDVDGAWSYTADGAHNEFAAGTTYTESFDVTSAEGTSTTVQVTIKGTNDAAVLSSATMALDETNAPLTTGGTLTISDVDSAQSFVAQTDTAGTHGTFSIDADGAWSYTAHSAYDDLNVGDSVTDTFTVTSADGTSTTVQVTINGTNEAAVLSSATVALDETDAALTTSGTLSISDVDSAATFIAQTDTAGTYGTFSIDADGAWSYTADGAHNEFAAGTTYTESFDVTSADGTHTSVTLTLTGTNDAPVITSGASVIQAENSATTNVVYTVSASDVDVGDSLTFSLSGADAAQFNIVANTGAVTFKASPNFEAPADAGGNNVYDITVTATDAGGLTGSKNVAIAVTNVNEALISGNDNVVTNVGTGVAFTIAEWALLANDSDPEGRALDVQSVAGASGGSVSHSAGTGMNGLVTFTDTSTPGGSFTYSATDGLVPGAPATVTIAQDTSGSLDGTSGNDILIGKNSGSTLAGGLGKDIVFGGSGNDSVVMLVTTGNVDTIDAGAGTDTLVLSGAVGGTGVMVVDLSSTTDQVVSIGGVADALIQKNFERLDASGLGSSVNATGSSGTDIMTGSAGNDTLSGGAGNDLLDGGAGSDALTGGTGDDTYVVDAAGDVVTENLNEGSDVVQSSITYTLGANVENLTLTGSAAIDGTGNSLINVITGNSGSNALSGGAGMDTIDAGDGDDSVLMLVTTGDVDAIDAGAGTDTLVLSGAVGGTGVVVVDLDSATDQVVSIGGVTDALVQTNFEKLDASGLGSSVDATGNSGDNILTGTHGDDTVKGGSGNDTIYAGTGDDLIAAGAGDDFVEGGDGDDTIDGDTGNDWIDAGSGDDVVDGNEGDDNIAGGAGSDTIYGASGNDTIYGGAGADALGGGDGNDVFVYRAASDSLLGAGERDSIFNFTRGADKIDLSAFPDLVWSGTTPDTAFGVWYVNNGTNTFVYADTDGVNGADLSIGLANTPGLHLSSADFIGVENTAPTVTTDLLDYAPGGTAAITASNFSSGDTLQFQVLHVTNPGADNIYGTLDDVIGDNSGAGHEAWYVTDGLRTAGPDGVVGTADDEGDIDGVADGNIVTNWYVNPDDSLDATFLLTAGDVATGQGSTTTFTDHGRRDDDGHDDDRHVKHRHDDHHDDDHHVLISGTKYNDLNHDHEQDTDEPGLSGWTIVAFQDKDDSETLSRGDKLVAMDTTDEDGHYSFNLDRGKEYIILEKLSDQTGWFESPDYDTTLVNNGGTLGYGRWGYAMDLTGDDDDHHHDHHRDHRHDYRHDHGHHHGHDQDNDDFDNLDFANSQMGIDTIAPTVAITMDNAALNIGDNTLVTFTFSEAPSGSFIESDILLSAGLTLVGGSFTVVSPTSFTAVVAPAASFDGNATVSVAGGSFTDAALNPGIGDSENIDVDTIAPTVAITDDEAGATANIAGGTILYTFTFSQPVNGFTAGDVDVVGGAKGAFTGADGATVYTLVITPTAGLEGDLTVNVAAGVAADLAANGNTVATQSVQTVDTLRPTITSGATASAINENSGAGQVVYHATATDSSTPVTYSLGGGTDDSAFTIDSGTGAVTLTADPNYEDQASYSFAVTATDAAGNDTTKAVTLAINNLDEVAPSFTSGATATASRAQ